MKHYLVDKIAECPICQISKTERVQYPGLLEPLPIPQKKWSEIVLVITQTTYIMANDRGIHASDVRIDDISNNKTMSNQINYIYVRKICKFLPI
jgi:hypothetical protein